MFRAKEHMEMKNRILATADLADAVSALSRRARTSRRRSRVAFVAAAVIVALGFSPARAQVITAPSGNDGTYITEENGQLYSTTPNGNDGTYLTSPITSPPLVLRNGNQALYPRR
jgi:hypothetical protein